MCHQTVQWTLHCHHNRLGGDVSLPSQSQSSQPILPTVVVPSPPAILTNPEAEDEDLELPTLAVDEVAAACQVVEVHPLDPMDPSRWASA